MYRTGSLFNRLGCLGERMGLYNERPKLLHSGVVKLRHASRPALQRAVSICAAALMTL